MDSRISATYAKALEIEQKENLNVGDLVLLVDENALRNLWMMGQILLTISGQKSFERQVQVTVN